MKKSCQEATENRDSSSVQQGQQWARVEGLAADADAVVAVATNFNNNH